MNLPAHQMDVWKPATDEDKLKALGSFVGLPAKQSISPEQAEIVDLTFDVALKGVTRYGLECAVEAILQGSLNHEFAPNPVELRKQCDEAMKHHAWMRQRIARQDQIKRERIPDWKPPTPEAKARVAALVAGLHSSTAKEALESERAEIRARYGMTDEAVASIKDQPIPSNFKQLGKA